MRGLVPRTHSRRIEGQFACVGLKSGSFPLVFRGVDTAVAKQKMSPGVVHLLLDGHELGGLIHIYLTACAAHHLLDRAPSTL